MNICNELKIIVKCSDVETVGNKFKIFINVS